MKIIVGLGNPGQEYANTRHNVGFLVLDRLKLLMDLDDDFLSGKFHSQWIKGDFENQKLILLKPQTYMNKSGLAVIACMQFFKVAIENIIVVHDDLDLPLGVIRYKKAGGHGGHNGVRDIITKLGKNQFQRIKIGIGRPENNDQVTSYVLGQIQKNAQAKLEEAIDSACMQIKKLVI